MNIVDIVTKGVVRYTSQTHCCICGAELKYNIVNVCKPCIQKFKITNIEQWFSWEVPNADA